jgi:hypothetical protein
LKPFPQLAGEFVLATLSMTRSTYEQPLPSALESDAATAHDSQGCPIKGKYHTYAEMTAAGLWKTRRNWLAWCSNYRRAAM